MTFDTIIAEIRQVRDMILTGVGDTRTWLSESFEKLNSAVQGWVKFLNSMEKAVEASQEGTKEVKKKGKERLVKISPTPEHIQQLKDLQAEFASLSARTAAAVAMSRTENKRTHPVSPHFEVALCRCATEVIGLILESCEIKEE